MAPFSLQVQDSSMYVVYVVRRQQSGYSGLGRGEDC